MGECNWRKIPYCTMLYCLFLAVCDFRLDFDTFTTNGPVDTTETNGGECQDSLTITTVTN